MWDRQNSHTWRGGEEKLELRKQREQMGDSRGCGLLDRLLCPDPTEHVLSVKVREKRKEKTKCPQLAS